MVSLSKHFRRRLINAKVDLTKKNLVFHSFRHACNTSICTVLSENMLHCMIGHKSLTMTKRNDQAKPEERLLEFLPESDKLNEVWN